MARLTFFNSFLEAMPEKLHNLGADSLVVLLTNTEPVVANTQRSDITQIAGGTGYTTGGLPITVAGSSQSGGVYKLLLDDLLITATGVLGPFRYLVFCNETSTGDLLIGWLDYGTPITMQNTNTFRINLSETDGLFWIRVAETE